MLSLGWARGSPQLQGPEGSKSSRGAIDIKQNLKIKHRFIVSESLLNPNKLVPFLKGEVIIQI